ncbi:MAG: hypothetical protein ACXWQO_07075 [Bdellovibrionota bacterium]
MKIFSVVLAALIVTFSAGSLSAFAKDGDIHEKVITVGDVYIPSSFDSSSDAFVVVNGWFPHSCYKIKDVSVQHINANLHEITTTANVTEGMCLTVIVPFHKEVQLGKLAVGEHKLRFLNGDGSYMEKSLTIER